MLRMLRPHITSQVAQPPGRLSVVNMSIPIFVGFLGSVGFRYGTVSMSDNSTLRRYASCDTANRSGSNPRAISESFCARARAAEGHNLVGGL